METRASVSRPADTATVTSPRAHQQPASDQPDLQSLVGEMVRAAVDAALPNYMQPATSTIAAAAAPSAVTSAMPAAAGTNSVAGTPYAIPCPDSMSQALLSPHTVTHSTPAVPPPAIQDPASPSFQRASVPANVAQLIVTDRYIELSSLLDQAEMAPQALDESREPLCHFIDGRMQPATVRRPVPHFGAWATAFLRYASVYVEAHPATAASLLAHMAQVSSLQAAGLGLAWRDFDEMFRRARELHPGSLPWGATPATSQLWLNAIARGIAGYRAGMRDTTAGRGSHTTNCPTTPAQSFCAPLCLAYNRPAGCTRFRCTYSHVCRGCQGPHSHTDCPRQSSTALAGPSE